MPISFDGFVYAESNTHNSYPDNVILVHTRRHWHTFYLPAAVMRRLESLNAASKVDLYFDNDRSVIFDFNKSGDRKCFRPIGTTSKAARISGAAIISGRFVHGQEFLIEELEEIDGHVRVLAIARQETE